MSEAQPLLSPTADRPAEPPSSSQIARSLRVNAISIFPPEAFEEEVVYRRIFGRQQIIMSRPAGVQHILVDNSANYRRTPAGIRILRPLLGQGLLLSRGEDWRQQRRTLAPAFAPRTLPILARHVARAANAAVSRSRSRQRRAGRSARGNAISRSGDRRRFDVFARNRRLRRRIARPDHPLCDSSRAAEHARFPAAGMASEPARCVALGLSPALAQLDPPDHRSAAGASLEPIRRAIFSI